MTLVRATPAPPKQKKSRKRLSLKNKYRKQIDMIIDEILISCTIKIDSEISVTFSYNDLRNDIPDNIVFGKRESRTVNLHNTYDDKEDRENVLYKYKTLKLFIDSFIEGPKKKVKFQALNLNERYYSGQVGYIAVKDPNLFIIKSCDNEMKFKCPKDGKSDTLEFLKESSAAIGELIAVVEAEYHRVGLSSIIKSADRKLPKL